MKLHLAQRHSWQILLCAGLLALVGLLCLWGLEPTEEPNGAILHSVFYKQLIFGGLSAVVLLVVTVPAYIHLRKWSYVVYAACLLTIVVLLIFGRAVRGTKGWIPIGPFTLQPAEFMKIGLIIALARFMMYQKNIARVRGLIGPILLTGVPMLLVLKQPDLGTAMVFLPVCMVMIYAAGARVRHLAVMFGLCILLAAFAYFFVLKDYQRNRLVAFVAPESVSRDSTLQQDRAVRATATGGVFGRGLWESLLYSVLVPDKHTDFIFPVIGEEMGFVGCTLVLTLYGLLFYLALRIAYNTREPYGRLLVVGMTTFIAVQMMINVGMAIGLAPITGLTLPFISYGGSSLLTTSIAVGIIINVGEKWVPSFAARDFGFRSGQIRTELGRQKWIRGT